MTNAVIGALRVTLGLDSAAFEKGSKRVQKQGNSLVAGLKKAFAGLGAALAAALAGIGVKNMFGKFIEGTTFAQAGQAQLAAAIKSTGGAAKQTLAALNAQAAALQGVTNYGDEVVNTAQALLLTFTKVQGDTFPRATAAILDMAEAMKMDLRSATVMVGKALNDPVKGITAMSRAGIQFTDDQKEVIKQLVATGKTAEAQAMILAELETQFGGSAKAARNTLGGAIQSLKNSFGDLFEIGRAGSEFLRLAIENLVTALSNPTFISFVKTIGVGLFGAVALATNGIAMMVNGVSGLIDWLASMPHVLQGVGAAMAIAFGPAIVGMIATMTVSMTGLALSAVRAAASFIAAWAAAAAPLTLIIAALAAVVGAVVMFRDEIATAIGVDVVGIFKDSANFIIGAYVGCFDAIKATWSMLPNAMSDVAIGATNAVIGATEAMINKSIQLINKFLNGIKSAIQSIPGMEDAFSGFSGIGEVSIGRLNNPNRGAAKKFYDTWSASVQDAQSRDYIGGGKQLATRFISDTKKRMLGLQDEVTGGGALLPVDGVDAGGGGGGGGKGKGGGKGGNGFAEILEGAEQRIKAWNDERAAIGLTEEAAAKLRNQTDLLNQAQQKGIALSEDQRGKLMGLGAQMGTLEVAVAKAKDAFEFAKSTTKGFFNDLKSGLTSGKGLWNSFADAAVNALGRIADRLLDGLIDQLFTGAGGSGGKGGGLSAIFSGIGKLLGFANGGEFKVGGAGGIDSQLVAFRASPNETVSVTKPGQMGAANENRRNGGNTFYIDARGAQQGVAEQIRQALDQAAPGIVSQSVRATDQAMRKTKNFGGQG